MAMHLTTFSPKCCCTVSVTLLHMSASWHPYSDFEDQLLVTVLGCDGVENGRELIGVELDLQFAVSDCVVVAVTNGQVKIPPWTTEKFFMATRSEERVCLRRQ